MSYVFFFLSRRFAAALIDLTVDCWVMNVVPTSGPNTLPVIYDRGLIGVTHDWYNLASLIFSTSVMSFSLLELKEP